MCRLSSRQTTTTQISRTHVLCIIGSNHMGMLFICSGAELVRTRVSCPAPDRQEDHFVSFTSFSNKYHRNTGTLTTFFVFCARNDVTPSWRLVRNTRTTSDRHEMRCRGLWQRSGSEKSCSCECCVSLRTAEVPLGSSYKKKKCRGAYLDLENRAQKVLPI